MFKLLTPRSFPASSNCPRPPSTCNRIIHFGIELPAEESSQHPNGHPRIPCIQSFSSRSQQINSIHEESSHIRNSLHPASQPRFIRPLQHAIRRQPSKQPQKGREGSISSSNLSSRTKGGKSADEEGENHTVEEKEEARGSHGTREANIHFFPSRAREEKRPRKGGSNREKKTEHPVFWTKEKKKEKGIYVYFKLFFTIPFYKNVSISYE